MKQKDLVGGEKSFYLNYEELKLVLLKNKKNWESSFYLNYEELKPKPHPTIRERY